MGVATVESSESGGDQQHPSGRDRLRAQLLDDALRARHPPACLCHLAAQQQDERRPARALRRPVAPTGPQVIEVGPLPRSDAVLVTPDQVRGNGEHLELVGIETVARVGEQRVCLEPGMTSERVLRCLHGANGRPAFRSIPLLGRVNGSALASMWFLVRAEAPAREHVQQSCTTCGRGSGGERRAHRRHGGALRWGPRTLRPRSPAPKQGLVKLGTEFDAQSGLLACASAPSSSRQPRSRRSSTVASTVRPGRGRRAATQTETYDARKTSSAVPAGTDRDGQAA